MSKSSSTEKRRDRRDEGRRSKSHQKEEAKKASKSDKKQSMSSNVEERKQKDKTLNAKSKNDQEKKERSREYKEVVVQRKPLIMRPKKEDSQEDKLQQTKNLMDKISLKLKKPVQPTPVEASSASGDGVPIKFGSFKIPKKKDPEKAKLFKYSSILKKTPGDFKPNEEVSAEMRGESERKVITGSFSFVSRIDCF